jgi:hypothetical protein
MHLAEPSPSSSRAHSRSAWHTVAWSRPIAGKPLYPCHASVWAITIGQVARRTTFSKVAPSVCSATVSRTCPLARRKTPRTGGRSLSQLPCPRAVLALRRGGSRGSRCGTPFFPRVLKGLVGLQNLVVQREPVPAPEGRVLESTSQVRQFRAVAADFAGQWGGGDALGDAAKDQDQFAGPPLGAVQGRTGKALNPRLHWPPR